MVGTAAGGATYRVYKQSFRPESTAVSWDIAEEVLISDQNAIRTIVVVTIPTNLKIAGEVLSSEDLLIEGAIRGNIHVPNAIVTIAKGALVDGDIRGKVIRIHGTVHGTVSASERIEVASSASLTGNVSADHVVISDGAVVNGHIDMNRRTIASRVQRHQATANSDSKSMLRADGRIAQVKVINKVFS